MFAKKLEQRAFLLSLILVTVLFFYLLKPFFAPVFWACAISLLFHPLQQRLERTWGSRPNLTALVTLLLCIVLVVMPVILLLTAFFQEAVDFYQRIKSGEVDPQQFFDRIRDALPQLQALMDRFNVDLDSVKQQVADAAVASSRFVAQNALSFGQGAFQFFLYLALMLYLTFFLLRDGPKLLEHLIRALPLGDQRERLLFGKFAEVTRATIKGNLVVALVQGALGGIIFWILAIPGALLWGVIMALLSLIPAVGAGLVWAPAAIYLFATDDKVSAAILVVYGVVVIGLADNILRPILVGRDTKLPDWMVLLSTLGGLTMFGINGFVIGPLIAALFIAFWQIFRFDFAITEGDDLPILQPDPIDTGPDQAPEASLSGNISPPLPDRD